MLEQRNKQIDSQLKAQSEFTSAPDAEKIDKMISFTDPISEGSMKIHSKYHSLEDCIAMVKKAYEKDMIDVKDYLKEIRNLSTKQAKQL